MIDFNAAAMNSTVTRKLAAILSADMVGYSRLMGVDEEGTLAALQEHLAEIIDPAIAQHHGRTFKTTGDGVLVEFASVVDAVRCALAVQAQVNERNAGVPEDRRIIFRIGVNLGDVMVAGGDIYGDGVNVAARVQGLADPGSILITGPVYDQVRGKIDAPFEDLGEKSAKNIAQPVRVWRVGARSAAAAVSPPAAAMPSAAPEAALTLPDKPSIVVLPFENMSGDPEQTYFSDGMTEDIITDLFKISGLFVIARNTAFAYRGKGIDVRQVARELGVRHVLEGSVRKAGNRVRITAQLVDGADGGHVWAERFDRELTDIFAVQDEVTQQIVAALSLKLTRDEQQRLAHKGTENVEAYDFYLRGRDHYMRIRRLENLEARRLFERAIELDPNFAEAVAGVAITHNAEAINGWSEDRDRSLGLAYEFAQRAAAMDDNSPEAHTALALVLLWRRQNDAAAVEAEKAIALAPNDAAGYFALARIKLFSGHPAECLELVAKAMRLDPHHSDLAYYVIGQAHYALGQYEEAIAAQKKRLARRPKSDASQIMLAASYGQLGRKEEARAAWDEALRIGPRSNVEFLNKTLPFKNPADGEKLVEGLRKAGLID